MLELPPAFCLTKIGRYSGQEAPQILRRKELERQAGDGVFWWGVGESKCPAIAHLRKRMRPPKVLFIWQRQHAKQPKAARLLFETYERGVEKGYSIPEHVLMARSEVKKGSYFALVCRGARPLTESINVKLNLARYLNLKNDGQVGNRPGSNQNTLVLVENPRQPTEIDSYTVIFEAELVEPFCVRLSGARELSMGEADRLDDVTKSGQGLDEWASCVQTLRRQ